MITLHGANGTILINLDRPGSRVGDITLSTRSNDTAESAMSDFCLRAPFSGGGMTSHAHEALRQFAKPAAPQPDLQLERRRTPLVLLGDDGDSRSEGFTYLEISSDAQGFLIETRTVGPIGSGSGPIRITDPEQMRHLANLYQAVEREQRDQKSRIQHQFAKKSGLVYDPLVEENMTELKQDCEKYAQLAFENPGETRSRDEIYTRLYKREFSRIRDTGIFLLKAGMGLPQEIEADWHKEFAAHPEVKTLLGRGR